MRVRDSIVYTAYLDGEIVKTLDGWNDSLEGTDDECKANVIDVFKRTAERLNRPLS